MCLTYIYYTVVVVLVDVLVDVVVDVDVVVCVVLVLVVVDVVVDVEVLVLVNIDPNQLSPLQINQPFWVLSQYSSPAKGLAGADASTFILPIMLVMCVGILYCRTGRCRCSGR